MKYISALILLTTFQAQARSSFQPLIGKYEVISVLSECSSSVCIQERDLIAIGSTEMEAALSVFPADKSKRPSQIIMKEYSWFEEGHFAHAQFETKGDVISWSSSSNSSGQYIKIQPKGNILILEGDLRFSPTGFYPATYYKLVMRPLNKN